MYKEVLFYHHALSAPPEIDLTIPRMCEDHRLKRYTCKVSSPCTYQTRQVRTVYRSGVFLSKISTPSPYSRDRHSLPVPVFRIGSELNGASPHPAEVGQCHRRLVQTSVLKLPLSVRQTIGSMRLTYNYEDMHMLLSSRDITVLKETSMQFSI